MMMMTMMRMQLIYIALAAAVVGSSSAFHTPSSSIHSSGGNSRGALIAQSTSTYITNNYRRDVSVGLFRDLLRKVTERGDNNNGGKEEEEEESKDDEGDEQQLLSTAAATEQGEEKQATPFFASNFLESRARETASTTTEGAAEVNAEASVVMHDDPEKQPPLPPPPKPPVVVEAKKSPTQVAEQLRAQAARIRLEAEKRQVELTLQKIEKLNSQLEKMKTKENVDPKSQKSLEDELKTLKSQLITNENGEVKPVSTTPPVVNKVSTPTATATANNEVDTVLQPTVSKSSSLSSEALEDRVTKFNEAPEFMRILVAKIAGYGVDESTPGAVNRLNATDIVLKLHDDNISYEDIMRTSDFTDESEREQARNMLERVYGQSGDGGDEDKPQFTKEQIQEKVEELDQIPKFLKSIYSKEFNDTDMALMLLEEEYNDKNKKGGGLFGLFGNKEKGDVRRDGERIDVEDSGAFSRLFSSDDAVNGTSTDKKGGDLSFMIESLYPKSTRKEDEAPDRRLVDAFLNDVVASTNSFIPNSKPISVPGGYVSKRRFLLFVYNYNTC